MTDPNAQPKPRLASEGQIFVSLRAAEEWLAANDFRGLEEARRDLTELLLDAHRTDGDPSLVRLRHKRYGLDLQARIALEGRLIIVTHINVRDFVWSQRRR